MTLPVAPSRHHYGEWSVWFRKLLAEAIAISSRTYLVNVIEGQVSTGMWKRPNKWPWVFITNVAHPISTANLSGGQIDSGFVYDIVVETTGSSLDEAEDDGALIIGDIIAILTVDMGLEMNHDGVRYARSTSYQMLEPRFPVGIRSEDIYVWQTLQVTIHKKLELV